MAWNQKEEITEELVRGLDKESLRRLHIGCFGAAFGNPSEDNLKAANIVRQEMFRRYTDEEIREMWSPTLGGGDNADAKGHV